MHNTLDGLPKRTLIDTNLLLDAAFVSNGAARRALTTLLDLGFSLLIDEMIEQEAMKILKKLRRSLGLNFDPYPTLNALIRDTQIIRLPPSTLVHGIRVNRADRHVVSAAQHYTAWVLTGDAPLIVECQTIGVPARMPWDVVMEASLADGNPPLNDVLRAAKPTRYSGSVFGRVTPGGWGGMQSVGQFTVCDVENVGRLYYDTDMIEWVFEMPAGVSARVKCPLTSEETWAVCGMYRLPGSGKLGRVTVRAGKFPSTVCASSTPTMKHIGEPNRGNINFGHSTGGKNHWDGYLRAVVVGPQTISKETWKAIVAVPEAAPNPYDSNMLSHALRASQTMALNPEPGGIYLPTEEDLWRLGN